VAITGKVDLIEYYGFFIEVVGLFGETRIIARTINDKDVVHLRPQGEVTFYIDRNDILVLPKQNL